MIRTLAGLAVVAAACRGRRAMKGFDGRTVLRGKGEVHAARQLALRALAVRGRDPELVEVEVVLGGGTGGNLERLHDGLVEPLAGREVFDDELHVIDETSSMDLHPEIVHRKRMADETWTVMRQGDDGNPVEVRRFASREEAEALAAELEARGHKQVYWVTSSSA
jgi:hypothetical protein